MILDYVKRPVKIQALQFTGNNYDEVCDFIGETLDTLVNSQNNIVSIFIYTLEGRKIANIGDYVIKDVEGGVSFCKPNIFNMTYEVESN